MKLQKVVYLLFAELILVLGIVLILVTWIKWDGSDEWLAWITNPFRAASPAGAPESTPLGTHSVPKPSVTPTRVPESHALRLEQGEYIRLGASQDFALATFTLETWFNRMDEGRPIPVGVGGILAVPLITRGWSESAGQPASWNYFLGITAEEPVLVFDYVEGEGQSDSGAHHTITGTLPIGESIWYHAAVTFDGEVLKLYLDGNLETIVTVGAGHLPAYEPMQSTTLAAALDASGKTAGFFEGMLDETRLWIGSRSQGRIQNQINQGVEAAPGLVGRWGFNEGAGYVVNDTSGARLGGIIRAYAPQWMPGAPFDILLSPPHAPIDLVANVVSAYQVDLTWQDLAWNETGYQIERIIPSGSVDVVVELPLNASAYQDTRSLLGTGYCYRLSAVNLQGASENNPTVCVTTPPEGNFALALEGKDVTLSVEAPLLLEPGAFTVEAWIQWTGIGTPYSTGAGGVAQALPLVTSAGLLADNNDVITRWMLGIDAPTGLLVADFEDRVTGQHHPVYSSDPITMDAWHHVAASYDGSTWRLYLDGQLEAELQVGLPFASQPGDRLGLGSLQRMDHSPQALFQGTLDEVRVWQVARSHSQILQTINTPLTEGDGLVMRWGFGEGAGNVVHDSQPGRADARAHGGEPAWQSPGAPFDLVVVIPPDSPVLVGPVSGSVVNPAAQRLQVIVDDVNGQNLEVTFYGRPATLIPSDPFTFVVLPDTQNYTLSDSAALLFQEQANWIVRQQNNFNIQMVSHLGDITENGNIEAEWQRASQAMAILDQAGIRSGIIPGNHDLVGDYAAYRRYFPPNRYQEHTWYGGYLGDPNDGIPDFGSDRQNLDNYQLFSVSGMDFILINLETDPPQIALDWAAALLQAYAQRWAVLTTHHFIDASGSRPAEPYLALPGHTSPEMVWQQVIYPHCNVFLVLSSHEPGEARRTDANRCGEPVYQLLQDYQDRANGGNGWLRYLVFKPLEDQIEVYTYSPSLEKFETDADSQFTLDFPMAGTNPFREIGTVLTTAGSLVEVTWADLLVGENYEWYVVVSDGQAQTISATWLFHIQP